jgi:phage-related protein (TIGR01555 family)
MAKSNHKSQPTADSYENMLARVGMHTQNQHSASTYRPNWTSRNRMLIENAYRSSWIIGAAVDSVADDMTRKGFRITSEIDPKARGVLESLFDELELWENLNNILKWSRLYGGALGMILIEGQAPFAPLRPETIGKGKFKGLLPLDRWQVEPDLNRRIKEIGKDLGKPEFYAISSTGRGIPAWKIHHSRLIRFDGVTLPYQPAQTENEWGMSVVERIYDRLTAFDSATTGAAQLVYKAHLRTYSIDKLREIIARGGAPLDALLKHMDMIRMFQSNEGMTLMDKNDVFETHQYSFSGLDNVLAQFAEQISGAVGIPLVRLFGQSPQGFSTGDADLANYYDNIGTQQERRLRQPIRRLLDVMHRSEFGQPLPEDFTFEFNPLWQMSDLDRSTIAVNTVNALNGALDGGMMNLKAAMNDLRETADITGIGGSITDEDINNADDGAPPQLDNLGNAVLPNVGVEGTGSTDLNGAQISSMVEIVSSVAAGTLPRDTGIQMLMSSYNMAQSEAERIMGSVGDGFVAKSEAESTENIQSTGKSVPDKPTGDSQSHRGNRFPILRWFK